MMAVSQCELTKDLLLCNPGFDYEGTKARYFLAIAEQPAPAYEYLHITRERFAQIAQYLFACENASAIGADPPTLTRRRKCFKQMELYRADGDLCLIKKRASPAEPIIKHLVIEDSFDVYVDLHLRHSHCGRAKLRRLVKQHFLICNRYTDLFVKSCNICLYRFKSKKNKLKLEPAVKQKETNEDKVTDMDGEKKFLLDIFNMAVPDGEFKFVLFCRDMSTSYLLLRPLIDKCHKEVATELLQIVLTFGSPGFTILTRPRNQEFFLDTIMIMNQFGLNLQKTSVENLSDGRHKDLFCNAKGQLEIWMNTKNSTNWGLGCHLVQWQLNNMQHCFRKGDQIDQEKTPYLNMFGRLPVYPLFNDEPPEGSLSRIAGEGNIVSFEDMFETKTENSVSEHIPRTFFYSAELVAEYLRQKEKTTENMDDTS